MPEPLVHDTPVPATFAELGLTPALVTALTQEGYEKPTPIQGRAIPHVLAGRDLLACAQTGTGKTAAFVLPIIQRLAAKPSTGRVRALILTPTRELASQIAERAGAYGQGSGLRHSVIFGGVGQKPQEIALRRGVDIVVATPGRLLDLLNQGVVRLDAVECFVLDEADRMLDMGFVHDVKRVIAMLPAVRQTLLFSATMPDAIVSLSRFILHDPVRVSVAPAATPAELVTQTMWFVPKSEKRNLLKKVLDAPEVERTIVFTRTKHGANRVAEQLVRSGIEAAAIHGNKSQNARERALEGFRAGTTPVLVATDIAARGIDVDGITHVVNYDLPDVAESYVHRIGRTGRAGAKGSAISFCDAEERPLLVAIERLMKRRITVAGEVQAGPYDPNAEPEAPRREQGPRRPQSSSRNGGGGGGRPGGGGGRPGGGGGGGGGGGRRFGGRPN